MRKGLRTIAAGVTVRMGLGADLWLRHARPWEPSIKRAYRLCELCGHTKAEVDVMIDNSRHATLTREQQVELYGATYTDPVKLEEARRLCMPCVEAALDAAFEGRGP